MVYHEVHLGPSESQMASLVDGDEIKLQPHAHTGEVTFMLTTAQVKRLEKAMSGGKGFTLKLSAAQVKRHAQHGSGRFSDIAKGAFQFLKPALKSGLAKGLDYGKDFLVDKISDVAGLNGSGIGDVYAKIGHEFGPHVQREAMQKQAHMHMKGSGWADILKGLAHAGVDVAGELFGGSVKKHHGGSFMSDLVKGGAHGLVDVIAKATGNGIKKTHAKKKHAMTKMQMQKMHGGSFLSDLVKGGAHGLIDVVAKAAGGGLHGFPNQFANPNESLRASLLGGAMKKKASGGLFQ